MPRNLLKILITIFKITSYLITGGLVIIGLFLLTIILVFPGFIDSHPPERLATVSSPDGKLDAMLIRFDAPAFSSDPYNLYIVPKGEKYSMENMKLGGYHLNITKIIWQNENELVIKYNSGHITSFDDCGLYAEGLCRVKLRLVYTGNIEKENVDTW